MSDVQDLAKQLEDQGNVSDPSARASIQSRAVRFGGLFQNFGSLLLELGRTVMTLRLGQTPVNLFFLSFLSIFNSFFHENDPIFTFLT